MQPPHVPLACRIVTGKALLVSFVTERPCERPAIRHSSQEEQISCAAIALITNCSTGCHQGAPLLPHPCRDRQPVQQQRETHCRSSAEHGCHNCISDHH